MSKEVFLLALSPILAVVIGILLKRWLNRRKKNTWQPLKHRQIPLWVIHNIYRKGFPNKYDPIQKTMFILKGTFYEYMVKVKDNSITEPFANINHLRVYRRVKPKVK